MRGSEYAIYRIIVHPSCIAEQIILKLLCHSSLYLFLTHTSPPVAFYKPLSIVLSLLSNGTYLSFKTSATVLESLTGAFS